MINQKKLYAKELMSEQGHSSACFYRCTIYNSTIKAKYVVIHVCEHGITDGVKKSWNLRSGNDAMFTGSLF